MGYRIVRLSDELFRELFTEGRAFPTNAGQRIRITRGLPEGARVVDVSRDLYFASGHWALKVFHPDWPDAEPGQAIPECRVEFAMEQTAAFRRWHFGELTEQERDELRVLLAEPHGAEGE